LNQAGENQLTVRAILLGDRLTIDRAGQDWIVSAVPFCYRKDSGYVVIFRYGAVVLAGLDAGQEQDALAPLMRTLPPGETSSAEIREEERVSIELQQGEEEGFTSAGKLRLRELTAAHVLVLADVLAKSVALARYERDIAAVFDTIEPAATRLAETGRVPRARKALLQLIGEALRAQHRVSGRIAFAEKPEILWDHP